MSRVLFALAAVACATGAFAQEVRRADLKPGLLFTAADKSGFSVTRLEAGVGLTLNPGDAAHPRSDGGQTFTWQGYIQVVTAGKYRFDATLLGGLKVSIDDQLVLGGERKGKADLLAGAEVELKTGIQKFVATLERTAPGVRVELNWAGPRFRREPIPYFFFGHTLKQRPATFVDDVKREHGRFLFEEFACVKCHTAGANDPMAKGLAERGGPALSRIAERAYPGWIDAWLADPKKLRPHTAMPAMFAADELGQAQRYAVTAYLSTLGKPVEPYTPPAVYPNDVRQSLDRGAKLYLTAGCATCHGDQLTAPPTKKKKDDDEDDVPFDATGSVYGVGTATGPQAYYTLNHVGSKTSPAALAKWLKNPLETNPHGRMPNMQLSDRDALDLARHLCKVTDDKIATKMPEPPKIDFDPAGLVDANKSDAVAKLSGDEKWRTVGKMLFVSKGCVNCHAVEGVAPPKPEPVANSKLALIRARPTSGCVGDDPDKGHPPGVVPKYAFTPDQRAALAAFLQEGLKGAGSPSPVHSAKVALKRFNCLNCHARDGEGGIDLALSDMMKARETAENADDVQPPRLTGIGRKMRTSWMKEVLLAAGRARPWMTLRMPQYGDANVGKLHEHLPLLDGATTDDAVGKAEFTKEKIETGKALAGKQGHGCISCHDISGLRGGGTRGPDLATTNQRVRFDWYTRWMHQPQRMVPGTKMPQAFIEGKALLDQYYGGDGDKQIEALWAYFSLGPGLPLPAGLEPPKGMVIAVRDRPEVLRTFMPDDAGTKCVAVGYPGGLNVVFDSSQCRLGYAWSGNFLDVQPVWDGRGGNPARVIGQKFWAAPAGFPWAVTAGGDQLPDFDKQGKDPAFAAPLPDGKAYTGPMAVKFKGYTTDDQGNPTFKYALTADDGKAVLGVTEAVQPTAATVANGLTRKFGVKTPAGKAVWLNVGGANAQPKLYWPDGRDIPFAETVKNGDARVVLAAGGDAVQVVQADQGAWRFVKDGDRWRVYLRLDSGPAMNADVTLRVWALPRNEPALLKELK